MIGKREKMQIDITGQKFNTLTAVKKVSVDGHGALEWLFKCDCGNDFIAVGSTVKSGGIHSCGCVKFESPSKTHGLSKTKEYNSWASIIARCENSKDTSYFRYGGRGIKMCERWRNSFEFFILDMGMSPSDSHSIDRKDNNKGYDPENCRWATKKEQALNRRSNNRIEIEGVTKCVTEWCEHFGISWHTYKTRKRNGVPLMQRFLPPNTIRYPKQ